MTASSAGTTAPTQAPKYSDALALNYANSVETIFRCRATGSRYAREVSNTALLGLSVFTGAAGTLNYSTAAVTALGMASGTVVGLQGIFDAKGRANAYFDAATRVHAAIKDFVSYNLNDISEEGISPNGWSLVNIVQANIDMVDKVLNGHLPTPADMVQATEPLSAKGAKAQPVGSAPVNNISAHAVLTTNDNAGRTANGVSSQNAHTLISRREPVIKLPPVVSPPVPSGTADIRARRQRIVSLLEKLGGTGTAEAIIADKTLTPAQGDLPEVTVCKAILEKAAPEVTGVDPTISKINHFQRTATLDELVALEDAMSQFIPLKK